MVWSNSNHFNKTSYKIFAFIRPLWLLKYTWNLTTCVVFDYETALSVPNDIYFFQIVKRLGLFVK